jgi:hypothetical protein
MSDTEASTGKKRKKFKKSNIKNKREKKRSKRRRSSSSSVESFEKYAPPPLNDTERCFKCIEKGDSTSLGEFQRLLPSSTSFAAWVLPAQRVANACSLPKRLELLRHRHCIEPGKALTLLQLAASRGLSPFVEHIVSTLDDIEREPEGLSHKQALLDSFCPITGLTAVCCNAFSFTIYNIHTF